MGKEAKYADRYIADLAAEVEQTRSALEYAVARDVLSNPVRWLPIADAYGVTPAHFNQIDLRLIYCGAGVANDAHLGHYSRLALIARALRNESYWDDAHPPLPAGDRGPLWNEQKLIEYADWLPTPDEVHAHASLLHDVADRLTRARDHFFECVYALKAEQERMTITSNTQIRIIHNPTRKVAI